MPWGNYGEMLWQGIYIYDKNMDSHFILRTGEFCPLIYRSQYDRGHPVLIVKEEVLRLIESVNLTGITVKPIIKEKIVKLNWETWDLLKPEPQIYPSGDMDAEEYITRRKHNETTAEQMGNLYALIPQKDGLLYCEGVRDTSKLVEQSLSGIDVFIDRLYSYCSSEIYVSEKVKNLFAKQYGDLLSFQEIQTFVADEELMQHLEKEAVRKEFLKQREAEMTDADWKQWYQLRDSARKLIEGIPMLKSETAKKKRESNIIEKLNSANNIYPLKYENWMLNYWQKEM